MFSIGCYVFNIIYLGKMDLIVLRYEDLFDWHLIFILDGIQRNAWPQMRPPAMNGSSQAPTHHTIRARLCELVKRWPKTFKPHRNHKSFPPPFDSRIKRQTRQWFCPRSKHPANTQTINCIRTGPKVTKPVPVHLAIDIVAKEEDLDWAKKFGGHKGYYTCLYWAPNNTPILPLGTVNCPQHHLYYHKTPTQPHHNPTKIPTKNLKKKKNTNTTCPTTFPVALDAR